MNTNHAHTLPCLALVGAMVGSWMAGDAWAQAVVPADPPPAGSHGVVPEKMQPPPPPPDEPAPDAPDGASGNSLSDHLSRTGGVIKPPQGMDPKMVEPPPDKGAAVMPVIPPPTPDIEPR